MILKLYDFRQDEWCLFDNIESLNISDYGKYTLKRYPIKEKDENVYYWTFKEEKPDICYAVFDRTLKCAVDYQEGFLMFDVWKVIKRLKYPESVDITIIRIITPRSHTTFITSLSALIDGTNTGYILNDNGKTIEKF